MYFAESQARSPRPAFRTCFVQRLPAENYYVDLHAALEAHKQQSMFNVIDNATGWKIDLVIRKPRAFSREEFHRRQLVDLLDLALFVASAEDVIVSKLEWSSWRNLKDKWKTQMPSCECVRRPWTIPTWDNGLPSRTGEPVERRSTNRRALRLECQPEVTHVPQHQNPFQLQASGYRR